MQGKFVAYYRVSTDEQGKSGLGVEAQKKAVEDYLNGGDWRLVGSFEEIESGKRNDRPALEQALALCKREKARLIIAKLDRLSRSVATLIERKVDFLAVDNPHANKFTVHIIAAVAEQERDMISRRTKDALAAAKARGVKLGDYARALAARQAKADDRVKAIEPALVETLHLPAKHAAEALNARKVAAPRGGAWQATQIIRARRRLGLEPAG